MPVADAPPSSSAVAPAHRARPRGWKNRLATVLPWLRLVVVPFILMLCWIAVSRLAGEARSAFVPNGCSASAALKTKAPPVRRCSKAALKSSAPPVAIISMATADGKTPN